MTSTKPLGSTFLAVFALVAAAGTTNSQAATITVATSNGGAAASDWNVPATWSDNLAPAAGNDYVVGAGQRINSPSAATTQTFGGDSLRLDGDGSNATSGAANFQLRSENTGEAVVISSLIMNGGRLALNQNSTLENPGVLQGNVLVLSNSHWTTSIATRHLRVDSAVSGSASLSFVGGGSFQLANASNTFSGLWNLTGAQALFASSGATGIGSSFNVATAGFLRINDDWSGAINVAAAGVGIVAADAGNTYTLDLSVGNTPFTTAGTYTAAELNAATMTTAFTGEGTFVVIPEPASGMLALLGGALLIRRRR